MITGAHLLIYSKNPEADRAFVRDVLGFPYVDVGGGWLIFALPPAEMAFHPTDGIPRQMAHGGRGLEVAVLYLMCDNLKAQIKALKAKKIRCSRVETAPWGNKTTIRLPSGGEIGLYEPRHPLALGLKAAKKPKRR